MNLRLGAAVLAVALSTLTTATTASPASAGVDTSPPAVRTCHDLTLREGYKAADPDPAVPCAGRHTSLTIAVIDLGDSPDWSDHDALAKRVDDVCPRAFLNFLGGNNKVVQRSAHSIFWFVPTQAQKDAGAHWLRCDLVLLGGDRLMPLRGRVPLGGLPLPDSRAKCLLGERAHYAMTACSRPHQFRATLSFKYPQSSYPGVRAAKRFALHKCRTHVHKAFIYEWVGSRASWRLGYRHAMCLPKTRR